MPFDLPESEQELAGGYNVEYSSMKFALFFMGEYANMTAAAALMVTRSWAAGACGGGLDQPATTDLGGPASHWHLLTKLALVLFMVIWVALDVAALPL